MEQAEAMTEQPTAPENSLGKPCSKLIWDERGYHKCKAKKSSPNTECSFIFYAAYGDLSEEPLEAQEKRVTEECPKHFTLQQIKEKVGPAITLAVAIEDKKYIDLKTTGAPTQ